MSSKKLDKKTKARSRRRKATARKVRKLRRVREIQYNVKFGRG